MNATFPFEIKRSENIASADTVENKLKNLVFGKTATDYIAKITWDKDNGWENAVIERRDALSFDASCLVFHYGQEIFEGMKACRNAEGDILLFRAADHARRFQRSAARLCMPALPEALFVRAVEELVRIDSRWVPRGRDESLYIRPFMIASEVGLGVHPSYEFAFYVIASPVGRYFTPGAHGITVWIEQELTRAARGGTGMAKCGGNYAAGMKAQQKALDKGCHQVVFLDAAEHRFVEELGGMNIFFALDGRLVTPPLGGTILDGITRDSLLTLARAEGLETEERPYSLREWQEDAASGRLSEVFACGTAATVAPIGTMRHEGGEFSVSGGAGGAFPIMRGLAEKLQAIKCGAADDAHGWISVIKPQG